MSLQDLPRNSLESDTTVSHLIDCALAIEERLHANAIHRVFDGSAEELNVADRITVSCTTVTHGANRETVTTGTLSILESNALCSLSATVS